MSLKLRSFLCACTLASSVFGAGQSAMDLAGQMSIENDARKDAMAQRFTQENIAVKRVELAQQRRDLARVSILHKNTILPENDLRYLESRVGQLAAEIRELESIEKQFSIDEEIYKELLSISVGAKTDASGLKKLYQKRWTNQVDIHRAREDRAKALLAFTTWNQESKEGLYKDKILTLGELEDARTQKRSAEVNLEQAKIRAEDAERSARRFGEYGQALNAYP